MDKGLIRKVRTFVEQREHIEEAHVRSFMILTRKLLDGLSELDQNSFLILRLFCNWAAHIEITKSNTGLRILAEINDALVDVKNSKDPSLTQAIISQALGYQALRKELQLFLDQIGVDNVLATDNDIWAVFICNLLETIRDVPLSFPELSKLDPTKKAIYKKIAQNPIKPGAGVLSIQISRIDYSALGSKNAKETMCLLIRTEDTTTLVVPLLIDVRL
jgi:hypothetical protein